MQNACSAQDIHYDSPELLYLQVYQPLEFLFTVAAFTTLIENFLPQLIALPKVCEPCAGTACMLTGRCCGAIMMLNT